MLDYQNGDSGTTNLLEQYAKARLLSGTQTRHRLICKKETRTCGEGARQLEEFALQSRQTLHRIVGSMQQGNRA